ncbi:Crp/Fnr family transcriptional regulator [Dehalogenimonas sp. THU2]|uniref:Crp/Fnr family transcriptional regulator n=1 Tax=Dehalogenimonas sp. THU2 TaxID=3151121 RepID=UPI0032181BC2
MTRLGCMTDMWLFAALSNEERAELQRSAVRRLEYRRGDCLFNEGDAAEAVFLVTAGRIRLFKISEDGREITLGYLGLNDLFGEEILFAENRRTFNAEAVEDTRVCACFKKELEAMLSGHPAMATRVIKVMADKLSQLTEHLADVAIYDARDRILRTLGRLARNNGEIIPNGIRLGFRLTHDDLGAMIGTSRVTVTNVLKSLREEGLVTTDNEMRRLVVAPHLLDIEAQTAPELLSRRCLCFTETV